MFSYLNQDYNKTIFVFRVEKLLGTVTFAKSKVF